MAARGYTSESAAGVYSGENAPLPGLGDLRWARQDALVTPESCSSSLREVFDQTRIGQLFDVEHRRLELWAQSPSVSTMGLSSGWGTRWRWSGSAYEPQRRLVVADP